LECRRDSIAWHLNGFWLYRIWKSESNDCLIDLLLEDQTLDVSRADFQSTSAAVDAGLLVLLALKQHPIGRGSFATLAKPLRIPSDFLEGGPQHQHLSGGTGPRKQAYVRPQPEQSRSIQTDHSRGANVNKLLPEAMAMYCLPSTW
jgi:hypothetical protein